MWAKGIAAAVVVVAGAAAFDLAVLWIASGRVIEQLPF
jgi:hypothetical protein